MNNKQLSAIPFLKIMSIRFYKLRSKILNPEFIHSTIVKNIFFVTILFMSAALMLYTLSAKAEPISYNGERMLDAGIFRHYIDSFNANDRESVVNFIPNTSAWEWMLKNVPFFECPDKEIEEIYYFRW